jgi:hypothetical protein
VVQAYEVGNPDSGELPGAIALDTLGLSGIVEGLRGQEFVSGRCLNGHERSDALGSGLGNAIAFAFGGRAFGAGSKLGGLARGIGPNNLNDSLIRGLSEQGINHTPENIVRIAQNSDGKTIFLETGNSRAGLQHIVERHMDDFAARGISQDQIPDAVIAATTQGKIIGTQGRSRIIFEVKFNNQIQRIAVEIGSNGFIVSANPAK